MLNPFPELLIYSLLAPFILRVMLGLLLIQMGYINLTRESREAAASHLRVEWGTLGTTFIWYLGAIEVLAGLSLVVGFLTQIGALLALLAAIHLFFLRKKYPLIAPRSSFYYLLVGAVALSLLLSGGGAIAFDLPL